jgi:hypothetical protein
VSDDVMARIVAAVELGRGGEPTAARRALETMWDEMGGNDGDAFHRCVLAHFMADLQDAARPRPPAVPVPQPRRRPRRLGEMERAQEFLDQTRSVSDVLGDDPYGTMIKAAMEDIDRAVAEDSTERLAGDS